MKALIYIDESGSFNGVGKHLLGAVVSHKKRSQLDRLVESWFQQEDRDWRSFHSSEIAKAKRRRQLFSSASTQLQNDVRFYITEFRTGVDYGYDYYPGLVIKAIEHIAKGLFNQGLICHLEVFPESRSPFNRLIFESAIRDRLKEKEIKISGLTLIEAQKGWSPVLALADLLVNTYWSHPKFCRSQFDKNALSVVKLREDDIPHHDNRILAGCMRANTLKEARSLTIVETVTVVKREIVFDNSRPGARLWSLLNKAATTTEELDKLLARFDLSEQRAALSSCLDRIADPAPHSREETILVSGRVLEALGRKRFLDPDLALTYMKATRVWLNAMNHMGSWSVSALRVKKALSLFEEHKERVDWEAELYHFLNVLSVAYQNVFDFDGAIEMLSPYLPYFENRRSPKGSLAQSFHIGAYLGSSAINRFFAAAMSYHRQGKKRYEELMTEGLIYSEQAEKCFPDRVDKERQQLYRIHGELQTALLFGDSGALAAARELLEPIESTLREFYETSQHWSGNALYRVGAILKLLWLEKRSPLAGVAEKKVLKRIQTFSRQHPYQQILGYLAMCGHPDIERSAQSLLNESSWSMPIVKTIIRVFALQRSFEQSRDIDLELRSKLVSNLSSKVKEVWQRYGLLKRLEEMGSSSYDGSGPLELLPFNYC